MLHRSFNDVAVEILSYPVLDANIDMLYPFFTRALAVAETTDYTTIKLQPCFTS